MKVRYENILVGERLRTLDIEGIGNNKMLVAKLKNTMGEFEYLVLCKQTEDGEFNLRECRNILNNMLRYCISFIVIDKESLIRYGIVTEDNMGDLQSLIEKQLNMLP